MHTWIKVPAEALGRSSGCAELSPPPKSSCSLVPGGAGQSPLPRTWQILSGKGMAPVPQGSGILAAAWFVIPIDSGTAHGRLCRHWYFIYNMALLLTKSKDLYHQLGETKLQAVPLLFVSCNLAKAPHSHPTGNFFLWGLFCGCLVVFFLIRKVPITNELEQICAETYCSYWHQKCSHFLQKLIIRLLRFQI